MRVRVKFLSSALVSAALTFSATPVAATSITPPAQLFAQDPGTDYFVADYTAYERYLKRLAEESDRIKLVDLGRTSEGRTQWMAVVSSPANLARLDEYKSIARRLAKADGLTEEQARELASRGKVIAWIDAGQHANESVPMQGQIQVIYRMLTASDPETSRILDEAILLFVAANPDGMQRYADWYMRLADPNQRRRDAMPMPYQRFIGHDNNRDFLMSHMPETTNMNRALFREWFPQIVLSQHQMGLAGGVVFVSPANDPRNYHLDPLQTSQALEAGTAIITGLLAENKPGGVTRTTVPRFTAWSNGTLLAAARFHNVPDVLVEIIGGATPERIAPDPDLVLPSHDNPMPIQPQTWHQRQSIDYLWTINRALMSYAARNRESLLQHSYEKAMAAIRRGGTDHWTPSPRQREKLRTSLPQAGSASEKHALYNEIMRDSADRDPRAYIISAKQRDLPTTIAFLNALIKSGIDVEQAARPFFVQNRRYPAGSWIVRTDQAYRPQVLDMFEPQEYPGDPEYPGGPPKSPYEAAGYTLAFQTGIEFDRILDRLDQRFEQVTDLITAPSGRIIGSGTAGWIVGHETNMSFKLTNRLLKAGVRAAWLNKETMVPGGRLGAGAIWIPRSDKARQIVEAAVKELGIDAYSLAKRPKAPSLALVSPRVGVVDRFGGVTTSGWTQWLLEQFEFSYKVVFPQELDAGSLRQRFDVLVLSDGTVETGDDSPYLNRCCDVPPPLETIPQEYRSRTGRVTSERTLPQLESFLRAGGAVVAIGSSAGLFSRLSTGIDPALTTERDGKLQQLDPKDFHIPGSLLRAHVDPSRPIGYGMAEQTDVYFNRSQSFRVKSSDHSPIVWYGKGGLLRSGFALGEERLQNTAAVVETDVGMGKLVLVGPDIVNRAQSYGTFKLLFNSLLYGPAVSAGTLGK